MCTAVCAHREVFCWRDFLGLDVRVQSYVFFLAGRWLMSSEDLEGSILGCSKNGFIAILGLPVFLLLLRIM